VVAAKSQYSGEGVLEAKYLKRIGKWEAKLEFSEVCVCGGRGRGLKAKKLPLGVGMEIF